MFGAIAALSAVGFLFNLTIDYPGTDRPVILVDPLWMLGHVIRAVGLGLLTYHLRYQSAVGSNWGRSDGPRRSASGDQADLWLQSLQLGQALPTMPLVLRGVGVVPIDLEGTYERTCQDSRL